jgi:competence protein ComEC
LAVIACVVLLAPVALPARGLALLAFAPMLLAEAPRPEAEDLWLTALDIGQGTAVLVETAEGRLLYDTGPAFGPENDAGARVIAPFLRARGIDALEALVVSHEDLDHAGGALSVLRELRVGWVASSLPASHPVVAASARHHRCRYGEAWTWGRVRFDWLHPADDDPVARRSPTNARSCVLRIRSAAGTVLLAGDIEAAQERRLIEKFPAQQLHADLLLAPHHGSRTSSTDAFLDAVRPKLAVFQIGYRNRYRHPHPVVLQRYVDRGIAVLRSDAHGAVKIRMRQGRAPEVWRARVDAPRYWRVRLHALEGTSVVIDQEETPRDPD